MSNVFNADRFTPHAAQSSYYSDIFTNFTAHPDLSDLVIKKNEDAVKQAIRNLLLTNKYERPFQPDLGSNINAILFEPATSLTAGILETEIRNVISNYEPRVQIDGLTVKPNIDGNTLVTTHHLQRLI
jgi:phage baseplate assembly protein W